VEAKQLDEFIHTFYPQFRKPEGEPEEYIGNISVIVNRRASFDLMSLVRLYLRADFTVTFNPPNMYITESQNYFIRNLSWLMKNLVKMARAKVEKGDMDDSGHITKVDNDGSPGNEARKPGQTDKHDSTFPTHTHILVRLFTPPTDLERCPEYNYASIEIVIPQFDTRDWIDGKPLYACVQQRSRWVWESVRREQKSRDNWRRTPFHRLARAGKRRYEWDVVARVKGEEV
jgi:hypothetical protein